MFKMMATRSRHDTNAFQMTKGVNFDDIDHCEQFVLLLVSLFLLL